MSELLSTETTKWKFRYINFFFAPIHKVDPRARIILASLYSITVVNLYDLMVLTIAVCISLIFMISARLPALKTFKRVLTMDSFVIFMLIMLPFTIEGEVIYVVFGYDASQEGLLKAIEIALKANASVLSLMALVGSMETVTFGHALYRLKLPQNFIHLLLFTIRYIDILHQEYTRLRISMKARCFMLQNRWHVYKTFGYLIGMMLIRALERSERIMAAMKCRGFTGKVPLFSQFHFTIGDVIFSISFSFMLFVLWILDFSYATAY